MDEFWIFGYGSLMWNPGFAYSDSKPAHLFGYHRSLCLYSHYYRGTPEQPGLVMGLERGGSCRGTAFHIPMNRVQETYAYLVGREQINSAYKEKYLSFQLADGRKRRGLVFVADPVHPHYAGRLDPYTVARIVSTAIGKTGSNRDYVLNTLQHLRALGVCDHLLETIAQQMTE